MSSIIGETYTVKVIQPIGSTYPSSENIKYEVNYGVVEGVVDATGEPQEAYILGVEDPVDEFTGKLIAIIHRLSDVENKWVISNTSYTKEEIYQQVSFLEKYFKVEVLL